MDINLKVKTALYKYSKEHKQKVTTLFAHKNIYQAITNDHLELIVVQMKRTTQTFIICKLIQTLVQKNLPIKKKYTYKILVTSTPALEEVQMKIKKIFQCEICNENITETEEHVYNTGLTIELM